MSSTTQNTNHVAAVFTEHTLHVDGLPIRYLEAGQGEPVVVLCSSEELTHSPFFTLLAQQRRVIAFEFFSFPRSLVEDRPAPSRDAARRLAQALAVIGLDHYVLIGVAASAPPALWQALDAPEHVDALVLISPSVLLPAGRTAASGSASEPALTSRLGEIQTATLILLGTDDASVPPETGRRYVEQLPNCYYVLVYDAGQALLTERPDALYAAVSDFVQRRGAFIIERQSTAINP